MHFAQYDGQVCSIRWAGLPTVLGKFAQPYGQSCPTPWADTNNALCWLFLMVILTFLYKCSLNGTNVPLAGHFCAISRQFVGMSIHKIAGMSIFKMDYAKTLHPSSPFIFLPFSDFGRLIEFGSCFYYDQYLSSIMTIPGLLLWPSQVFYDDPAKASMMLALKQNLFRTSLLQLQEKLISLPLYQLWNEWCKA